MSTTTSTVVEAYDNDQDGGSYPYNGKVLLAAVILLSLVIFFVILLHIYARWFLSRRLRPPVAVAPAAAVDRNLAAAAALPPGGRYSDGNAGSVTEGLDAKLVASIPAFVYRRDQERGGGAADCVVCLSPMEDGERGRVLPRCKHAFHAECIGAWLASRSTCPICRSSVAPAPQGIRIFVTGGL